MAHETLNGLSLWIIGESMLIYNYLLFSIIAQENIAKLLIYNHECSVDFSCGSRLV